MRNDQISIAFMIQFFYSILLTIAVNLKLVSVSLLLKPTVIFRLSFKGHFQALLQWLTKNNFSKQHDYCLLIISWHLILRFKKYYE